MSPVQVRLTYDDYRLLSENGKRYQLIEGDLFMTPSPSSWHQNVSVNLVMILGPFVTGRKLGKVLDAPLDVILSSEDVVQPDVLFVSNARRDRIAPEGIRGAPDLVIEILSKTNRDLDLTAKRKLYARHGVIEYWIVDPDARAIVVYRLQEDPEKPIQTYQAGQSLRSPLLTGLLVPLDDVFRD